MSKFAESPWDFGGDFEVYLRVMGDESLTALPRGYEDQYYLNPSNLHDDGEIIDAGWCPGCKSYLRDCVCDGGDIFDHTDDFDSN